ncbi:MAG: NERD domain-containing protein [Thaumarchaeota archaeon]|nr:NERD domain-containing protein [Nitrososphaerota archaeon]
MAIIYGISQSEKNVIEHTPDSVRKIDDVDAVHKHLTNELASEKKDFFEKLPTRIKEKEDSIEKIKNDQTSLNQNYDKKIKILEDKKSEGILQLISSSFKIAVLKNYSKPKQLHKMQTLEYEQQDSLLKLKNNPQEIFDKKSEYKRNEVKRFGEIKKSPEYIGALGEVSVLQKLSQLSNEYHVFCDVRVELDRYVTYGGRRNLKSAQMDFVIVSKRGVVMIEVKNWSMGFYKQNKAFNPHEQTDRAGRVLWIFLKSWRFNPNVKNVLLSIRGNISYNQSYKAVFVSSLDKINDVIQNKLDSLSEKDVNKIVKKLKGRVTR